MRSSVWLAAAASVLLACASEQEPTEPSMEPSSPTAAAVRYRPINLGTLGGASSQAHGVGPAGHVVGESLTRDGKSHAFIWHNGVMTDLGTLGGSWSVAYAVNRAGKVVGVSATASGSEHAFHWKDGVMTDMGTFGSVISQAFDINTAGQIVGLSGSPFIYIRETFTSLRAPIRPAAINAIGQVAGEGPVGPGGLSRAVLWTDGVLKNLGTLGGNFSSASELNRHGHVVGISTLANGKYRAFIYKAGAMRNLGVPGVLSIARGINDAGYVVGQRQTATNDFRAFIWRGGVMTNLPSLGGRYSDAMDINPDGWIAGLSRTATDGPFATLWVPK